MPPQVLYFDLGNVLLSFSHERMLEQMAAVAGVGIDTVREAVFRDLTPNTTLWRYESGQLSTDEYVDHFCLATDSHPDRRRLEEAVCDIFEPIAATAELARALSAAGHRLAILSNTNPLQWAFVTDGRFPHLAAVGKPGSVFAWAVLSYEVGALKPERAIYDAAARRAGVNTDEILFVDDRPENVAGAIAAGIDAVLYTGFPQLADDLRARGISPFLEEP